MSRRKAMYTCRYADHLDAYCGELHNSQRDAWHCDFRFDIWGEPIGKWTTERVNQDFYVERWQDAQCRLNDGVDGPSIFEILAGLRREASLADIEWA